jgi:precorrin-2/cobalt-factor-2 C20-methyltransferase
VAGVGFSTWGCLFGVGVGPGDPELLTLKALRVLQRVPVICVPRPEISGESYALTIVRDLLDTTRQEVLHVNLPSDAPSAAAERWRDACQPLVARLREGQDVAFITEGDPMLYSIFSYVLESLRSTYPEMPVEVIPGVSSVMAAAARAAVPLVTHAQRLAILPTVYGIDDLQEAFAHYDTVVLMQVSPTLLQALANLEKLGLVGEVIYVRRATMPREQVVRDIQQLSEEDLDYFSLLIIKK